MASRRDSAPRMAAESPGYFSSALDFARPLDGYGPSIPKAGDVVGPYRLLEPLGQGGVALVFRAVHQSTGKLRCEARVIHVGGRIATAEGRLVDAEGKLYAHGTTTCLVMPIPAS